MENENNNPNAALIAKLTQDIERMEKELAELKQQMEQKKGESKPKPRKPKAPAPRLFNEAEKDQDHKAAEPTEDVLAAYTKKTAQTVGEEEVNLSQSMSRGACKACGTPYQLVRKNLVRQELDLIPGQYQLIKYYTSTYTCPACRNGKAFSTQPPLPLMKQSIVSACTVADIMVRKYEEDQSLAKQQKRLAKDGIRVSSATMANWIIRSTDWLKPLYRHMKQELLKQAVIHVDSTPVQMMSEDGTPTSSNARMYTYVSGNRCTPIYLFDYNGKQPDVFLKGFTGCLVSDCSPEYTKIPKVTHCACWIHMNELWKAALDEGPQTSDNKALDALVRCGKLMSREHQCTRMTNERRKEYRRNISVSTVEEFFLWVKTIKAEPGSKLAKAAAYAKEHQTELSAFLDHEEVSAVNSLAEDALEPFTTGKKVWQFSDTPKGAQSSTIVYSLIQTAKANGLDPYDYLYTVLLRLPFYSKTPSYKDLEFHMPWAPFFRDKEE